MTVDVLPLYAALVINVAHNKAHSGTIPVTVVRPTAEPRKKVVYLTTCLY